jgi:hypothetical protein
MLSNILKLTSNRFIAGCNDKELLSTILKIKNINNWNPIVDYAKESAKTDVDANNYTSTLYNTIDFLENNCNDIVYALKLSSFGPNPKPKIDNMVKYMLSKNVSKILLDAENDIYRRSEDITYSNLINKYNKTHTQIYKTYQMYRKSSLRELEHDIYTYNNIGIKLVRGAYFEQDATSGKLYTNIEDTHKNYNNGVNLVLNKMSTMPGIRLLIATHNSYSVTSALKQNPPKDKVEFAQLLGMNDKLSHEIVKHGYTVYKYMPYGSYKETLPYLIRRLYENHNILKHAFLF